jgi:hypothetical protein
MAGGVRPAFHSERSPTYKLGERREVWQWITLAMPVVVRIMPEPRSLH